VVMLDLEWTSEPRDVHDHQRAARWRAWSRSPPRSLGLIAIGVAIAIDGVVAAVVGGPGAGVPAVLVLAGLGRWLTARSSAAYERGTTHIDRRGLSYQTEAWAMCIAWEPDAEIAAVRGGVIVENAGQSWYVPKRATPEDAVATLTGFRDRRTAERVVLRESASATWQLAYRPDPTPNPGTSRSRARVLVAIALGLTALVPVWAPSLLGAPMLATTLAVLPIAATLLVSGWMLRNPPLPAPAIGELVLSADDDGLCWTTDRRANWLAWRGMIAVDHDRRHVWVWTRERAHHVAPISAFQAPEDADRFVAWTWERIPSLPSRLVLSVSRDDVHEHGLRMRRSSALAAAAAALGLAVDLVMQWASDSFGRTHTFGQWVLALGVPLFTVAGLASVGVLVVHHRRLADSSDLELTLEDGRLTITRPGKVLHRDAPLAQVTAFPGWVRFGVREGDRLVEFGLPVVGEDRARLMDFLRGHRTPDLRESRSFALEVVGRVAEELAVHILTVTLVLVLVFASLATLLWLVGVL